MEIQTTVYDATELKGTENEDPPAERKGAHRPPTPSETAAGGDRDLMALMGFAAGLSRVSYAKSRWPGDDAGVSQLLRDVGVTEIEFVAAAGSRAVLILLDGRAWVAFRGTCHLADWGANLTLIPGIHIGFRRRYARIAPLIQRWLSQHREQISAVVVTGHSQGGALATLAARDFARRSDVPLEAVLTFAAPRVFGPWAARRYDAMRLVGSTAGIRLGEVTQRVIYHQDVVPKVPSALFGFRHVGREWTLDKLARIVPKSWKAAVHSKAAPRLATKSPWLPAVQTSVATFADHNPLARAAGILIWVFGRVPDHDARVYARAFGDRGAFDDWDNPEGGVVPAKAAGLIGAWEYTWGALGSLTALLALGPGLTYATYLLAGALWPAYLSMLGLSVWSEYEARSRMLSGRYSENRTP